MSSEWQSVGRHHEAHPLGPGRPPAAAPGRAGCMGTARSVYAFKWNRLSRGQLGGPPSPPATALPGSVVSWPTPPAPGARPSAAVEPPPPPRAWPPCRPLEPGRPAARDRRVVRRRNCDGCDDRVITAVPTARSGSARRSGERPLTGSTGPVPGLLCTHRPCLRARALCA